MTTFTKEQLIKFANAILQTETAMASWDCMAGQQAKAGAAIAEIALAALTAEPVVITDDMVYAYHHALSDSSLGSDEVEEIKTGLRAAFANVTAPPAPVVPELCAAIEALLDLQVRMVKQTNHGASFFDGETIAAMNYAPIQARQALELAKQHK